MRRYLLPIFLGAFLLFQVQPLIGKCLLPWFGGTPAVWTTCLLFFQIMLLGGYLYAHLLMKRLQPQTQKRVHGGLLAVSFLAILVGWLAWGVPLIPDARWQPPDADYPILRIVLLLTISVGLPYLVLSTTSPLLQAWYTRSCPTGQPYRLYTLSNVGSLLALVTYPVLVEPHLDLRAQGMVWALAYAAFLAGYAYCSSRMSCEVLEGPDVRGLTERDLTEADGSRSVSAPTPMIWGVWAGLAALGSLTLLAVTNQVTQQVAVVPFLWVLPLALYLLSFIICFDHPRWYARWLYLPALVVGLYLSAQLLLSRVPTPSLQQIATFCATMFVCCMVCHGELAALKPRPRHLTSFYLALAVGGAGGGLLVAVIAPLTFKGFWEFPLALVLCGVVGLVAMDRALRRFGQLWRLAPWALLVLALSGSDLTPEKLPMRVMLVTRNFYGLLSVHDQLPDDPELRTHALIHGIVLHGSQFQDEAKRRMPTTYYGVPSGLGQAIAAHRRRSMGQPMRMGLIGLGAGTIATYARPGDTFRYYEIDPEVRRIARNPRYFTYLRDCQGKVEIVLGDARLSMERELRAGSQQYDMLVLDAFSGDVIPMHLLTKEAMAVYLAHLQQGGAIAANISNMALDLRPVVWALADHYQLGCAIIKSSGRGELYNDATWAILSADRAFTESGPLAEAAMARDAMPPLLWTDQYNSLLPLIRQ